MSIQTLFERVRGGTHTQFPVASSTKPFLQIQNPRKSNYFPTAHVKQSKSLDPSHVKHFGLHF